MFECGQTNASDFVGKRTAIFEQSEENVMKNLRIKEYMLERKGEKCCIFVSVEDGQLVRRELNNVDAVSLAFWYLHPYNSLPPEKI